MIRAICLLLAVFCYIVHAHAQPWSLYGGAGGSYDGFFRDASVTTMSSKWPFMVGGAIILGSGYKAENGFDFFGESHTGIVNIKVPVPGVNNSGITVTKFMERLMAGSGPRIEAADGNSSVTPYLQLGGAYLQSYQHSSSGSGSVRFLQRSEGAQTDWVILFGAGIDYHFDASVIPSSINLNFSYSPLNVFHKPYDYTVETATGTYDLELQGKLLQVMLSYRVYWKLGKQDYR